MKKILLVGNPNVGKSVLFSRLTGVDVLCSNYHGTTVSYCSGSTEIKGEKYELIDTPGTYSLEPTNQAEEVTTALIDEADVIINVIDATNLERNLLLTLQLLEQKKPVVCALNIWDDTVHLGIDIDVEKLQEHLGVPVVPTVSTTGEGVKELVDKIPPSILPQRTKISNDAKWKEIGRIIQDSQNIHHRHHTLRERLEDASVKPLTGLPIALIVLYFMFQVIITCGNWVIENLMDPLFYDLYGPAVIPLVESMVGTTGVWHTILLGEGENFVESLGLLTTGLYVPLDMVLPFVILFYFMLALLEDVGYLPRLATLSDTVMHRIGLHGTAVIPCILGFGCNVPGALSTRILETRKQRFIASTLLAISIPCLAQSAMIIGLLSPYGIRYLAIVYGTLFFLYLFIGFLLNKWMHGESPEILMEIPSYRFPNPKTLLKKVWLRTKWFLTEAVPYVLFGVLVVNLLTVVGFIDALAKLAEPLFVNVFGLPAAAVSALVIGFMRKDVAVGMLAPLGMNAAQLTIASTILAVYFPCIATFTVMLKELGWRDMLLSTLVMLFTAILVGAGLKILLL